MWDIYGGSGYMKIGVVMDWVPNSFCKLVHISMQQALAQWSYMLITMILLNEIVVVPFISINGMGSPLLITCGPIGEEYLLHGSLLTSMRPSFFGSANPVFNRPKATKQ